MKSRTIHAGTRRAERRAEQEDEEDGRGWKAISSHGVPAVLISDKKSHGVPAVLISDKK
jgi:hypothetical protein